MNILLVNFKRLTGFAQAHPGLLFAIFTMLVAAATGFTSVHTLILPQENPAMPPLIRAQAINVNRSARDRIFQRIDQRVAGVRAALATPVKDPF